MVIIQYLAALVATLQAQASIMVYAPYYTRTSQEPYQQQTRKYSSPTRTPPSPPPPITVRTPPQGTLASGVVSISIDLGTDSSPDIYFPALPDPRNHLAYEPRTDIIHAIGQEDSHHHVHGITGAAPTRALGTPICHPFLHPGHTRR